MPTVGTTGGSLTVAASNGCGSSGAQSLTITVNTVPGTPGAISGPPAVCVAGLHTYSVSPVSGATSYTWTLPSGWSGTSTTNSINATVGTTGGSISVTANNSCGSGAIQNLAVSVSSTAPTQPGAISGSASVCASALVTYSVAPVAGATSYTWSLPGTWSGTSTGLSINATIGTNSGFVTVVANNACGSGSSQTLSVQVSTSAPATPGSISGSSALNCAGNQLYSIGTVAGATSYTWTMPSGWTGTSTGISMNAAANTNGGTLSVSAVNACGSSSAQSMNISNTPLSPVISQNGNQLASNFTNGNSWFVNGSFPAGNTQIITPANGGAFTVTVTQNGCTVTSAPFNFVGAGIGEWDKDNSVQLFPNPTNGLVSISIQANVSGVVSITIHNTLGEKMMTVKNGTSNGSEVIESDVSNLAKGVYFVNITSSEKTFVKKLIIQ